MIRRLMLMLVAWMSVGALHAANQVSVEGTSGAVGSTTDIVVSLSNDSPDIAAAEIRIPLPDGVVPIAGSLTKNESRLHNHSVTADMKNGSYVIVIYNTSLSSIPKGEGELCRFKVQLADNPGNFNLTPTVKLSDKSGTIISSETSGGTLTVLGAKLTIDSPQLIDFGRVPIRATHTKEFSIRNTGTTTLEITGFESAVDGLSASFSPTSIEAGERGTMTLEYTPTVRSKEVQGRIYVKSNSAGDEPYLVINAQPFSVNELHIGNAEGISDEEVTVSVTVNNMEPLVGVEFTLPLPDALEYVEGSIAKSTRSSDMGVEAYCDASRKLRIILYNAFNKQLAGDDGEIVTFKLKLKGNTGTYYLNPEKVILTNREGENMTSASYGGAVSISSPRLSSDSEFRIGNVPLSGSNVFEYTVQNYGNAPLRIDKVAFLDAGYSCKTQFPLEIAQGDQGVLQIAVEKPIFGFFSTTMNIYSNDPSNRMKSVEVSGNFYSTNELSFIGKLSDGKYLLIGSLDNEAEIVAVQMDIILPVGVTCSDSDLTLSSRANSHSATLANVGSNRYRLIVFSLSNTPFLGNSGELFTLALNGSDVEGKEVRIENVKLSTVNGIDYTSPDSRVLIETIPISVKSLSLSQTEVALKVNETLQLSATVLPANATDKTVTWTSSNETVATVDVNGNVTAIALGEATITATCGAVSDTCDVTVVATPVESVTLSNTSLALTEGEATTLTATVAPADATDKSITWSSSNEAVASVSNDGVVTALSAGRATITATSSNGKTASCEVTVAANIIPVTDITISKTSLNLIEGETETLTATILPENATDKSVTWTSSDASVASVSDDGVVSAIKAGTAIITAAASNGKSVSCEVTVETKIIDASEVILSATSAELKVGGKVSLTATVLPEDATDKTVTWTSSNEAVASVDTNGNVTAVSLGETTITATCGAVSATCKVTVVPTPVENVTLSNTSLALTEGETATLTATVAPADATDKSVTWTSSDAAVATVDTNGKVTAVKAGKATITATSANGKSASCEVTVAANIIPVTDITISNSSLNLIEGETETLTATILPENATDKSVTWTSSDASIASVSDDGVVSAIKAGTAIITAAASNGKSVSCEVTVEAKIIDASEVILSATSAELKVGEKVSLSATVIPEDATDTSVTWTSSNETVATVDANGNVTAIAIGEATITATCGAVSAACTVTVIPTPVENVTLSNTSLALTEGETATLTATVSPADATDKSITWSSSNEVVASVSADGVVTALSAGRATITATASNGMTASCEVTVAANIIPVTGISISKSKLSLIEGETETLTATILPENATDKSVTWTSSDASVASVSTDGTVTALKAGTAIITAAASNGKTVSCEVTVEAKIIDASEVILSATSAELKVGEKVSLTATVLPENATDKTVTWNSSNEALVTVNINGNVTAIALGEATITATCGAVSATCKVTVIVTPVESVTLSNTSLALTEGETATLTATVAPADATDKSVTWSSSDEVVASVSADGVVTALSAGTATITATASNGKTASCEVTVAANIIPVTGISISKSKLSLIEGETETLIATILPENATDKSVTWSSSDASVASVSTDGTVTALKAGTAIITAAASNGKTVSCEVTVEAKIIDASEVILSATSAELKVGGKVSLTATVLPEDATDKTVTWTSSNEAVATVDANGNVKAIALGEATITATCGAVSATCKVTVIATPVESVTLSNTSLALTEGESATLTATVAPADATDKSITWSSSNEAVASVSNDGVVTALSAGRATITATASNGMTASCEVTVAANIIPVTGISISKSKLSLTEGETETLTATILPENATDKSVTWTSSDASVASVSADGTVTAVKAGKAIITAASSNGKTVSCEVTVEEKIIDASEVILSATSAELKVGEKVSLTATVLPENVTDKAVTWNSSNEAVATVDANGNVTAIALGEAIITATCGNASATCTVTVVPTPVESVSLSSTSLALTEGETATLTATVSPADATDKTVTWTSSDASIASVSAEGVVTAVKAGTATITATSSNGKTASCEVTVSANIISVTGISISKSKLSLIEGETETLTATILPENATDKSVTWTSSDASVASISADGVVTGLKAGKATITAAASNGKTASCEVTVEAKIIDASEVILSATSDELKVGEKVSLTATVLPEDATDKTVTWTSSNEAVATVDANGNVKAIALGEATITASCGAVSATCKMTVIATPVESVTLSNTSLALTEGESATLTATVAPADATDKSVTWSSSNEVVASVSADGVVTAIKAGKATITATSSNGMTASCEVTVAANIIPVAGITISKSKLSLIEGKSETLTATILPENATDKSVTWTSTDASVASVSADGVVSAIKAGTATITAAASNGKTVSCEVTVEAKIIDASEVILSATSAELKVGGKVSLTATVLPEDATDKTVTWTSSNEAVATVDSNGNVKAVGLGEATITATCGAVSATCNVTVVPTPVESVTLSNTSLALTEGETATLTATVAPADATDKSVTWSSSNEAVASVSADGVVTALSAGTATITATSSNGMTANCEVSVAANIIPVTGISISKSKLSLIEGETETLTATILPENATDKSVTWTSSDASVASVSADGTVTAVKAGKATITAAASNGKTASCEVTVEAKIIDASEVILSATSAELKVGEKVSLTATVLPEDATDKTVTWTSSNEAVATVDANGNVKAIALGEAIITATCGNASATCTVTVVPTPVESVSLSNISLALTEGESATLTATVAPADATDKSITWSSSNETVASVSADGVVTALSAGTATITATASNGKTASCEVTVAANIISVTDITISKSEINLTEGETETLTATILPENATDKSVTWSSSDASVASVSADGTVTAVKAGKATITAAASNGKTVSCEVTVEAKIIDAAEVILSATSAELKVGGKVSLTATVLPEDATDKTVTWTSSNEAVATVDANGNVKAIALGEATITATCGAVSATCKVTVIATPVESVTLSNTSLALTEGESATLTAIVAPADATDKSITWSSSDEAVASVSNDGVVTALSAGTATITATASNGKTASCEVTVAANIIPVTGISISKSKLSLTEGESETLTATIIPENATDKSVTWTSSDASVASVSADGVVTALKAGTAIITAAASNGKTASCEVTVEEKIIDASEVILSATSAELKVGGKVSLTVTVLPEDATDKTVTWTSSNETVATVDVNGNVTAIALGEATITATCGAVSATCNVTVVPTPVENVTLSNISLALTEGESATLTATVAPADATDKSITWSSSNEAVASVSSDGIVTALSAGRATITATASNGMTACCEVTVGANIIPVTGISISKSKLSLIEGETETLTATILPENATDKSVTWTSSDASVASVSTDGTVTALKAGTAIITAAASNGKTVSCEVTVETKIIDASELVLSATSAELKVGEKVSLTATVLPENVTDKTVTWNSSNEAVATVDSNGNVTAIALGEATITATCGAVSAACNVTVVPTPVENVTLSNTSLALTEGETATLTATVAPADATDRSITWTSSDAAVATVDTNGKVTAVKAGKATITATSANGKSASCEVTVAANIIPVTDITISKSEFSLIEGETETLTATILPENATDKSVTWTSSDASVASVSADGTVTAVKAGKATITAAASNGKTASCEVTVEAKIIDASEVILSATSAELKVGGKVSLTATVLPEDATDKTVTWTSSNEAVATVDSNGNVKAIALGEATITATCGAVSATCKVTVIATPVESVTLSNTSLALTEGETATLTATVAPADATDKSVTWTSSDAAVATVDTNGKVTAVKAGKTTITATSSNGKTASCEVTVAANIISVTDITISKSELYLTEGETESLTATILPDNATDQSITWTTSDASVATVDANGKVTAVKVGTATITASSSNGKTANCTVTVTAKWIFVESLTIDPTTWSGEEGSEFKITATVAPEDATDKTLVWTSSDETVATVDGEGNVKVLKEGNCVITVATADGSGLTAECVITSLSGVEVIFGEEAVVDVYDMNGVLVKKGCERRELKELLTPGVYILRSGDQAVKAVIR